MTARIGILGTALVFAAFLPLFADAWVDYGAYYYTPAPHPQAYYQPMYAYSYAPVQSSQNTYINQPQQQNYSFGYGAPSYGYPQNSYVPQYTPSYSYAPQYQYPSYGYGGGYNMYGQNVPYSYGYPTGDTVPLIGGQLCEFPDYDGRALCGSNPNQWIYDPWTGSWY
jgi:hypothetical protein